jgi:hypothetical protein
MMFNFCRILFLATVIMAGFGAMASAQENGSGLANISEILLPEFQATEIAKDGDVKDAINTGNTLWVLTEKVLWKWSFLERKVQKISLLQKTSSDNLISVGSDGLSIYVAYTSGVFQFDLKQGKVFKYPFSAKIAVNSAQFYGYGDSFWIIANDQLNRIDRYGKTIVQQAKLPQSSARTAAGFDAENLLYWYANKNILYKVRIDKQAKPEKVLQLKHDIKSIVAKKEGAIVTTQKTVLITDGKGGRVQTIPVEKARKIESASNDDNTHAYVFNDQILETFDLKTQSVGRFMLPVDANAKISGLRVGFGLVHFIADGRVHLFSIPATSKPSK